MIELLNTSGGFIVMH